VYACLAETIVLALEGRFENFTVGRAIEWPKVREIYQMGLKHGMKLAAISGVNGVFSDADIAKVRKLALAARAKQRGKAAVKRKTRGSTRKAAMTKPAAKSSAKSATKSTAKRAGRAIKAADQ
jgi:hypothetical protein